MYHAQRLSLSLLLLLPKKETNRLYLTKYKPSSKPSFEGALDAAVLVLLLAMQGTEACRCSS